MHQVSFHRKSLIFLLCSFVGFYDGCWIYTLVVKCHIRIQSLEKTKIDSINWFVFLLFCLRSDFLDFSHVHKAHTYFTLRSKREKNTSTFQSMWWGRISPSPSLSKYYYMVFFQINFSIFSVRKKADCAYMCIQSCKPARSSENSIHTTEKRFKCIELKWNLGKNYFTPKPKMWKKDTCIFWHNNQLLVVHVELQKRNSKQQSVCACRVGGWSKEETTHTSNFAVSDCANVDGGKKVATVSKFENVYFRWTDTDTTSKYAVCTTMAALVSPTQDGNWVSFVFFMHESFVYRCWCIFQKKIIRRAYTHTRAHSRQIFRIFGHVCVCVLTSNFTQVYVHLYWERNFSA